MKKNRSILELLILLKQEFEFDNYSSLCFTVSTLRNVTITHSEADVLENYISKNAPWNKRTIGLKLGFDKVEQVYFWEPYNFSPRIEWLNKHIKKNQK